MKGSGAKSDPKRPKKGDCPGCGKGVYADQPRAFENGAYYQDRKSVV